MPGETHPPFPVELLRFRQCPGCSYDWAEGTGHRSCSYYDCPYLPSALRVTCDFCGYNFFISDGQIKCDHDTCEHATQLRANVATYLAWREAASSL